jgi:hypothetical protein
LSIFILPGYRFLTAVPALSDEFKNVAVNLKAGFFCKSLLKLTEVTIGEVNNGATVGANQVVMVLRRPPHQVASVITRDMYLTDKTKSGEYLKSTINGYQSDAGVLMAYPLMYFGRGKVLVTFNNLAEYRTPLRGNFVTPLSHHAFNPFLGILHLSY